jgi:hypothetical protein
MKPSDADTTPMTPFFLHIPKTAGSSIRTLITLNYAGGEVASIYGDLPGVFSQCANLVGRTAGYRLVQGHIPYGSHLNLGLKEARYFFFLRHPVDRHFSDVTHALRDTTHGFHALVAAPQATPLTWATLSDQAIYFRNTATHYLSGAFFSREADLTDFHRAARVVLESEFVGLAERFNESVLLMARKLGWTRVLYEKRNVAPNPIGGIVTPEMRSACESRLAFDLALYRIACDRFERDARRHGDLLQEAARQLEELVAVQSRAFPDLERREYLVGDPVRTQEIPDRTITPDSPLGRWLSPEPEGRRLRPRQPTAGGGRRSLAAIST